MSICYVHEVHSTNKQILKIQLFLTREGQVLSIFPMGAQRGLVILTIDRFQITSNQ